MRRTGFSIFRLVLLLGVLSLGIVVSGHAQAPLGEDEGTAMLEGWPRSLPNMLDEMGRDAPYLLPRIDSLGLDYRYAATDTTSRWSFVLGWRPAERVLYEGEVLPLRDGPRGIRMTNVELRVDVRVDGKKRAEMIIGVDSMALRATPDRFAFNVTVDHERVFLDASPDEARQILSEGATLDGVVVERMGFSSAEAQRRRGSSEAGPRRHEPPRLPSLYTRRKRLFISWRVGPRPYYVGDSDKDGRADGRPRGGTVGRTPAADADRARGSSRDGSPEAGRGEGRRDEDGKSADNASGEEDRSRGGRVSSDEDDDEDDTDLRMPALATVAAVGIVAFAGGTAGLYGSGDTPLGFASGYTHPKGGIQLQAAVNGAVLENGSDQKLSVRALGFYDVFESRVQPAVGLGVRVDPEAGRDVEPAVSGGLAGNFERVVLYGGLDVVQGMPEIGVAYNFRYGRGEAD